MLDKYDHNLLLGYVEDDLPPKDRARVEAMLADDPRLASLLAAMIADRQALRSLPPEAAPGNLMEAVNLRLERQMLLDEPTPLDEAVRTHKTFRLHRALIYSGLAAMVLISGGVVIQTLMPVPWTEQAAPKKSVLGPLVMTDTADRGRTTATTPMLTPIEEERDLTEAIQANRSNGVLARPESTELGRLSGEAFAMKGGAAGATRLTDDVFLGAEAAPSDVAEPAGRVALLPPGSSMAPPTATQAAEPPAPLYFARLVPVDGSATGPGSGPVSARLNYRGGSDAASSVVGRDRPDPTAAPKASPVALVVDTDDADQTHHELVAWAVENQARVLPNRYAERPADDGAVRRGKASKMAKAALPSQPRHEESKEETAGQSDGASADEVLVVVTGSQIPELVDYLNNTRDRQVADLVSAEPGEIPAADGAAADSDAERPARVDAVFSDRTQESQALSPSEQFERSRPLAVGLSNGWGKLLQQQLPLSPRVALFGEADEMIVPVRINERQTPASQDVPTDAPDPAIP